MEYFRETLDRETGDLRLASIGEWKTVTEVAVDRGVGRRSIRQILLRMGLLQIEGTGKHSRLRLSPWAVEAGLGRRLERRGKFPFDVISPTGQEWIDERWSATLAEIDTERTASPRIRAATTGLRAWGRSAGVDTLTAPTVVLWLTDHFPDLSQSEIASVAEVTQQFVSKELRRRQQRLTGLVAGVRDMTPEYGSGLVRAIAARRECEAWSRIVRNDGLAGSSLSQGT